ncbi:MAG: diguanylate cyclase [Burkholderiaceae bacterium]|nr:diguanylate cyclase [Burkholderiaceae bacterium]
MAQHLILCVDDDTTMLVALRALLARHLDPQHQIEVAEGADEALELLDQLDPQGPELAVVVSDYIMPGMRGDELLVRIHGSHPDAQKIMLTGQSDLEAVKRSINEARLYRFIEKPFDNTDLSLTVGGALRAFEQGRELLRINTELQRMNAELEAKVAARTLELQQKNAELERLAITDPLTRLNNRLMLDKTLEGELARCQRFGGPLALILVDIDKFKQVNDSFGHQAGDVVLTTVAGLLAHGARETDLAGRWGGEEFMLICRNTDADGAATLAEKLRLAIQGRELDGVGRCTASFGVSAWQPGDNFESLVARADAALYRAKARGRNRVEFGKA